MVAAGNASSRQPEPEGCALSENGEKERRTGGGGEIEKETVSSLNREILILCVPTCVWLSSLLYHVCLCVVGVCKQPVV